MRIFKTLLGLGAGILAIIDLIEVAQDVAAEKSAQKKQKVVYEKGTTKITEF